MAPLYKSGDKIEGAAWAIGGIILGGIGYFITILAGGSHTNAATVFASIAGVGGTMGLDKGDDSDDE